MLRLDGGFGPEAHRHWARWHGYQVLAPGDSGNRANACARAVPRWEALRPGERWLAPAPTPRPYARRTQTAVWTWQTAQGTYGHSLLTTALPPGSLRELAALSDDRAALEAAFTADTGGLQLHRRRTPRLVAQDALGFLTDWAPNRLAWTRGWLFGNSPFADAALYRMIKELFPLPGNSLGPEGRLVKLRLKASHPHAKPVLACLTRLFAQF